METKKYLSLRTLFIRWLILFSLIPLILIVAIFAHQFKSTVQDEIFERLIVYTKQVQDLFNEYENFSKTSLNTTSEDKTVLYQLKTSSMNELRESLTNSLEQELPTGYAVYDAQGQLELRVGSREFAEHGPQTLGEATREQLARSDSYTYAYYFSRENQTYLHMCVVKRVKDDSLRWEGYLEKSVVLNQEIVQQIRSNLGLDIIFFGPKGDVFLSSLPEEQFTQEQLSTDFLRGNNHFFDVSVRGQTFGFISTAISWGDHKFLIAIGASKESLVKSLSRIMYMLLGAFFVLVVFLLIFSYVFTNQIIQPLTRLVEGIQRMKELGEPVQIENRSRNEIGLLTNSFNEMSQSIYGYRSDLETKIVDLERANTEVQTTQNQLLQSAKLASLGQLVAGVAHELNNPIGFVYSNMQHLREYTDALIAMIGELGKKNDQFERVKEKYDYNFISKDLPKLISSCEEGAKRTRDIVTGLRTFSRSSDKDQKKFSVTDCIDSTLDLLKGASKKEQIKVEKHYDDFIPLLLGNPNQISQVFMNIISNAYQAISGAGTIRIRVQKDSAQDFILVEISDTGGGIAPENIDKIFDPFFTTKDVGQGTGLGLSISYGIVRSHGGDIQVQSEPGRGTQFHLRFPVPK